MKHHEKAQPQTAFGLPRIVVVVTYFIIICFTGMAIQAGDPLQEMMKLNGAYSQIDNEKDRTSAITSTVGFGLSFAVLSGVIVGPTIDLIGAKLTGLLGFSLHALGYVLMFLTDVPILYYVAGEFQIDGANIATASWKKASGRAFLWNLWLYIE